jgi:arylsulfatase A-like enzyme
MAGKWIMLALTAGVLAGGVFLYAVQDNVDAAKPEASEASAGRDLRRPDAVFLIVVDTLRPDRLSCYGYDAHATPNIDRLAAAGVRFTRAQSVASWTRPSVGAIITSRYATQLALVEKPAQPGKALAWRERREQRGRDVPRYARTVAEMLREAGFLTAAFVDQPGLNGRSGYRRGFVDWYYPVDPEEIRRYEPGENVRQVWPSTRHADRCDRALIRELHQWLARNGQERLFVWLHLLTPHRPYTPGPEYAPPAPAGGTPSKSALYDGEVRAVDDMVGLVADAIEQYVGSKRSLIVFTSDHGEEFGEHGMEEHGHSLHREVIHVPLIIVSPALPAGQMVERRVRTIDILPTILELVGHSALAPAAVEGATLTPLNAAGGTSLSVYSEAMLYGSTERCLIEGAYKLMYDEQGEQWKLFDVNADPGETVDISSRLARRVESMRQRLVAFHTRLQRDFEASRRMHPADEQEQESLDDLEALRALGYISDE